MLVVYATRMGSSAEIAQAIGQQLSSHSFGVDVPPTTRAPDARIYEATVVGSAVYTGRWDKDAVHYLQDQARNLAGRPTERPNTRPSDRGEIMARHPSLSRTTHTLEMAQIDELNTRLAQHRAEGRPITAADLGLTGATLLAGRAAGGTVASSAVVTGIGWDGDPDFPYLHARFSAGQDDGSEMAGSNHSPRVDLHSAALEELCRRLRLHQVWGTGAA